MRSPPHTRHFPCDFGVVSVSVGRHSIGLGPGNEILPSNMSAKDVFKKSELRLRAIYFASESGDMDKELVSVNISYPHLICKERRKTLLLIYDDHRNHREKNCAGSAPWRADSYALCKRCIVFAVAGNKQKNCFI